MGTDAVGAADHHRLAITGGTVYDGTGRPPIHDAVVEVAGGHVVNVRRAADGPLPPEALVVDATGATVLPGLVDAHVHCGRLALDPYDTGDPEPVWDWWLSSFTRWGVTTVRDTGSPDLGPAFARHKAAAGAWPRYFGSGPNLDGPPGGHWPGLIVVEDEVSARRWAQRLIDDGADFLKVYVWMAPSVMQAVVEVAHAAGVRVAAHVGHRLTVEDAVRTGVDALEHVRVGPELLTAAQRAEVAALPVRAWDHLISFRPWRYIEPGSSPALDRLLDLLAERGVTLTPTLVLSQNILRAADPDVRSPTVPADVPEAVRREWTGTPETEGFSAEDWAWAPVELARQLEFVGLAHRRGIRITAGTDCGTRAVLPGSSLHEELRLLVAAGLSPAEAIRAATQRAAELIGCSPTSGTLEKAKVADLLVVEGDPLADIGATRAIRHVIKGGRVLPRAAGPVTAGTGASTTTIADS